MVQNMQVSTGILYTKKSLTLEMLRIDERFIKVHGKRKAFFKGGNSTCRLHIRQHFELYEKRCKKENIPIHHWCIPRALWKEMEEEKEAKAEGRLTKKQKQQKLDFPTITGPLEFTREAVLHAVTVLIATNYQVT
jgi:hypothetical protein